MLDLLADAAVFVLHCVLFQQVLHLVVDHLFLLLQLALELEFLHLFSDFLAGCLLLFAGLFAMALLYLSLRDALLGLIVVLGGEPLLQDLVLDLIVSWNAWLIV